MAAKCRASSLGLSLPSEAHVLALDPLHLSLGAYLWQALDVCDDIRVVVVVYDYRLPGALGAACKLEDLLLRLSQI